MLWSSKGLRVLESCGGRRRLSGHVGLMQQPELEKTGRPAAVAAMELERENSGERRKTSGWRFNGPGYL